VLSNPLNLIGMSDLVSKDLMDKFHTFLAHTYVTIGQVQGRTFLPLPPNDVTSSEKTSSKDKAHILEGTLLIVDLNNHILIQILLICRCHYNMDKVN
jgi:dynein heavy chain, axonemal